MVLILAKFRVAGLGGTNGRAYATVLRLSVCLSVCRRRLWRYVLWLNGAS